MKKKFKYTALGVFIRRFQIGFLKLYHSTDTPHQIAFGFSFGAFIGIFPTFGLGLIMVAGFGMLFKYNIPASVLGSLIGMPWLTPFWIAFSVALGKLITGSTTDLALFSEGVMSFIKSAFGLGIDYLIGNTILSITISVGLYFFVRWLVGRYRRLKIEYRKKHPGHNHTPE